MPCTSSAKAAVASAISTSLPRMLDRKPNIGSAPPFALHALGEREKPRAELQAAALGGGQGDLEAHAFAVDREIDDAAVGQRTVGLGDRQDRQRARAHQQVVQAPPVALAD